MATVPSVFGSLCMSMEHFEFWILSHHCLQICSTYNLLCSQWRTFTLFWSHRSVDFCFLRFTAELPRSKVKGLQGYWHSEAKCIWPWLHLLRKARPRPGAATAELLHLWSPNAKFCIQLKGFNFQRIFCVMLSGHWLITNSRPLSCFLFKNGFPLVTLCPYSPHL